jgi:hypothetical protein
MGTPAQTRLTLVASADTPGPAPAEPVPVAVLARTSTLSLQDPAASLNRQIRSCQAWLPAGWYVAGVYWDVESGGIDLEQRSQGQAWEPFAAAGIPRDGGLADLLTEAKAPLPPFRRRRVRRHRAIRPGHVQRAETGKGPVPRRHPAIRHRRARLHRRRQRHHGTRPQGEAGSGRMVPAATERKGVERAARTLPRRVEHRMSLSNFLCKLGQSLSFCYLLRVISGAGQTGTRSPNATANAFMAAFQPYVPVPRSPRSRTSPSPSICRPVIFRIPR